MTVKVQPKPDRSGGDGTVLQTRELRSGAASLSATSTVRVRNGGFEWRYGRSPCSKYHAGSEFARLWEKAGIASAGSASFDGSGGGTGWAGLPEARMVALDRLRTINARLGSSAVQRLVAYAVEGKTPKEIASGYPGTTDRQLASVLDFDLQSLAEAMGYAH